MDLLPSHYTAAAGHLIAAQTKKQLAAVYDLRGLVTVTTHSSGSSTTLTLDLLLVRPLEAPALNGSFTIKLKFRPHVTVTPKTAHVVRRATALASKDSLSRLCALFAPVTGEEVRLAETLGHKKVALDGVQKECERRFSPPEALPSAQPSGSVAVNGGGYIATIQTVGKVSRFAMALPAGYTFASYGSSSGWACAIESSGANNTIQCGASSAAGASMQVLIATIPSLAAGAKIRVTPNGAAAFTLSGP